MDILTAKRIEELKNNPYVMAVGQTSILLTAECIQTIYSRYVTDPTISGIDEALKELGFTVTGKEYILPESLFVRFMEPLPDIEVELAYWRSEPDSNRSSQNSKKAKENETKAGKNSQGEEASSGESKERRECGSGNKAEQTGQEGTGSEGTRQCGYDSEKNGSKKRTEQGEAKKSSRQKGERSRSKTGKESHEEDASEGNNEASPAQAEEGSATGPDRIEDGEGEDSGEQDPNNEKVARLTDEELLATGKFVKSYNGVSLSPDVERQVLANFPETTIEQILEWNGLSASQVGENRVYRLGQKYKKLHGRDPSLYEDPLTCTTYTAKVLRIYEHHPYVASCEKGSITLSDRFMDEAQRIDLPIHSLLRTFCIDPGLFSYEERTTLARELKERPPAPIREPGFEEILAPSPILEQVYYNRLKALETTLDGSLADLRKSLPSMSLHDKKELFMAIEEMPKDPNGKYTLSGILEALDVSRTTYYGVLGNETYGEAALAKEEQDLKDVELIRKVMAHRGFRKGARQIYMQMEDVTGTRFGLQKIRRLMKKFDIHSGIREPNEEKRKMRAYLKGQVKPNLLKRRFRLYRPNQVRLTDVTYLSYGPDKKRAYCSASIDPVTCKLASINISDRNDLDLVLETLKIMNEDPTIKGALLHSDRGCLYLTPTFQKEVKEMGLAQSMSKLGNCWDNAPQECFNSQLKEEVVLSSYETFEELKMGIEEYALYYNTERHIFNRKMMTPIQYEQYLLSMNDEEWAAYLKDEEEKYEDMKKESQQKAKAHAKELGT